jgi:hypothetical protein
MMKVLAAEMSDPSRLRRGKQYAHDGSVLDIVIEPGLVTCEIQGSRSLPYVATVAVRPGDGMPLRRDVTTQCTCPDDDNWEGYACKHVVAAMFAMSNEFLLEPELLDVWRGRGSELDEPADERRGAARGHLRVVRDERPEATVEPGPRDRLAPLLTVPPGTSLPDVPEIEPIDPDLPRSRELAAILRDALANLRIRWD